MAGLEARTLKKHREGKPKHKLTPKKQSDTWEKKMKIKEKKDRVKKLSKQLKDEINDEQQKASDSRKANAIRKQENEKKNMVVQEISNVKAIKKLSPKHRKKARIFMKYEL